MLKTKQVEFTHPFLAFLPQCIMNFDGLLSGLWVFPPSSSFMVVVSSEVVKNLVRWPPIPGTLFIILHCLLTERLCCLSSPLKRSLANSRLAMELVLIEHRFESDLRPMRRLKVFQVFLLEWVKSISLTVSSYRLLWFFLWFIRSAALASADSLSSA